MDALCMRLLYVDVYVCPGKLLHYNITKRITQKLSLQQSHFLRRILCNGMYILIELGFFKSIQYDALAPCFYSQQLLFEEMAAYK